MFSRCGRVSFHLILPNSRISYGRLRTQLWRVLEFYCKGTTSWKGADTLCPSLSVLCTIICVFVVLFLAYMGFNSYLCNIKRDTMKSAYKYELADAAGVSRRTFQRWLRENRGRLSRFGVKPTCHMLPPRAVRWICLQYGIDF